MKANVEIEYHQLSAHVVDCTEANSGRPWTFCEAYAFFASADSPLFEGNYPWIVGICNDIKCTAKMVVRAHELELLK